RRWPAVRQGLLASAELDDQLLADLLDARVNIAARWQAGQASLGGFSFGALQIIGHGRRALLKVELDQLDRARTILDGDAVARLEQHARDAGEMAVDLDMAMRHQLPRGGAVGGKAEAVDDVIQATLHDDKQHLAGVLRGARGQLEVAAELTLEDAIEPLQFLLLAQAQPVLAGLAAAVTVHAGRHVASLDGTLGTIAAGALQIELDALAATEFANRIEMTSHVLNDQW